MHDTCDALRPLSVGTRCGSQAALLNRAGRFDFCKALYQCSSCKVGRWQGWEDLLQLGLYPASLHPVNQTFVTEAQLQRMRATARHTVCSNRATATIIDGVGAAVYGQVGTK